MTRHSDEQEVGKTADLVFSVDIETTGLVPVRNSMLSIGIAAIRDEQIIGTFERNIRQLPGAGWDVGTIDFWNKHPEAFRITMENPIEPEQAFIDIEDWVESITRPSEIAVFAAYPAGFDFSWCLVYGNAFGREWPFGFAAIDMQTMASSALGVSYSQARNRNWPDKWKEWINPLPHVALNDSISQAYNYIAIKRDLNKLRYER